MGLFECRTCKVLEQQILSLRAQLSDQQDLLLKLEQSHQEAHKTLIDRILALTSPPALRAARQTVSLPEGLEVTAQAPSRPLYNFPGLHRDRRPPMPIRSEYADGTVTTGVSAQTQLHTDGASNE